MQCHATLHCKYVPDFRVCLNMQGFGFMRQGCLNSFHILFCSYTDSCTDVSLLTGEYLQLYLTTPPPGRWCAPTETVWGKHQTSSARVSPEAGGRPPRKKTFFQHCRKTRWGILGGKYWFYKLLSRLACPICKRWDNLHCTGSVHRTKGFAGHSCLTENHQ